MFYTCNIVVYDFSFTHDCSSFDSASLFIFFELVSIELSLSKVLSSASAFEFAMRVCSFFVFFCAYHEAHQILGSTQLDCPHLHL